MKKFVSLILTLAMVLSLMAGMAISVGAETEYTYIEDAEITGTAIPDLKVGDTLPELSYSVPEGANYTVEAYWQKGTAGDTVASGKAYELVITVTANAGYGFTNGCDLLVNGEDCDYMPVNGLPNGFEYMQVNVDYAFCTPMDKVEVNYTEPEAGEVLSAATIPEDANYTVFSQWYDYEIDEYLEDGTEAEKNHEYDLEIYVYPAEGYMFTADTEVWINGERLTEDSEDYLFVEYDNIYIDTREYILKDPIDKVELTLADPVVGQPFPQAQAPADANYTVETIWQDGYTDEEATGNVQEGGVYSVMIAVEPASGCEFAEDMVVTFNGQVQDEYDYDMQPDKLYLYEVYSFAQPIDKIEVFYELPEAGEAPGAITIPEGANYSLIEEETGWLYYDSYEKVTGVFEDGYRYELQARVALDHGYVVGSDTKFYVNGKETTDIGWSWLYTAVTVYDDSFSLAEAIDKVELPAWPDLKVGDTLESIENSGEKFSYEISWEGYSADGTSLNDDTVMDNAVYYLYINAWPNAGYEFTEDTVITIGGQPLSNWSWWRYSDIWDGAYYNFNGATVLDTANVVTSVPGVGQKGGSVAVSADAPYTLDSCAWGVASDETYEDVKEQTGAYKAGDRVLLTVVLETKSGYIFDYDTKITVNGKEYTVIETYGYKDYVGVVLDLGVAGDAPDYNGLTLVDGVWGYYEGGVLQTEYTGLVPYGDNIFYVENGILDFTYTDLVWYLDAWHYVANSQLTEGYTGLVWFNDNWFYVVDSVIDWTFIGLVEYEGNYFYVQNNLLDWSYTGLGYHDGGWYFIQNGLLQLSYTGLVWFNDNWFYIENGHLTWDYTGLVEYEGNYFYVQNNVLNWSYTGLGYYNNGWYYVENALLKPDYNGLTCFNDTWFYINDGQLTWTVNGLREYNGDLFYIVNSEVDWTYNGPADYEGTTYTVVNGFVDL